MRDAPGLGPLLSGAVTWEPVVSSWLGGRLLAEVVPVDSGSVTWSTHREVQGALDLTVPRKALGRSWAPGLDTEHPLARFGQQLHVTVRVTSLGSGESWDFRLGTFLVTATECDAGSVRVTGESILRRLVESRLRYPIAPRAGGTLKSEARRLVPSYIGLIVDPSLTDRACPAMSWGESRVDALEELATAWPARLREDVYGNVQLLAPLNAVPAPVETLTDGEGGTVVSAYASDSRDGAYNVVVARGQEQDDAGKPAFQAVAEVESGPFAVDSYGEVVRFFSSPLITSMSAARSAARSLLNESIRPARTIPVTLAPDPRWELDDAVAVVADGQPWWGYVSGVQIPLTTGDGDQRMDVETHA